MVNLTWTDNALTDIEDIGEYISKDSVRYAKNIVKTIYDSAQLLKSNPKIGRIVAEMNIENIREIIKGNYRIIYIIKEKANIEILTVHHSAKELKEL
ncbi:type II toxin-antitoxin system RelE/ParE family toxin [Bacteroidota bacterium]